MATTSNYMEDKFVLFKLKTFFFLGLSLVGFVFSSFTFSSLNKSPDSDRLVCSSSTVTAQFATNLLKHDPI